MGKGIFSISFFLLFALTALGQVTKGVLLVKKETDNNLSALLEKLSQSPSDTNKINLLLKISHVYWYSRTLENKAIDSTMLYAGLALELSKTLNFTEGGNEAKFMQCKALLERNQFKDALDIASSTDGEEKARLLLLIAERGVFNFPPDSKEYIQAMPLINQASAAAKKAGSTKWMNECFVLTGKFYFNRGNVACGKRAFMDIIQSFHQSGETENVARTWSQLGTYMPENNNTYRDIIYSNEMAVKYYRQANNLKEAGYSLRDLVIIRGNHGQIVQAEKDLLEMLRLFSECHEPLSITTYYIVSDFYRFNGRYDKALDWGFAGVKAAGDNPDKQIRPYIALGNTYAALKKFDKAIQFYQIVLQYDISKSDRDKYVDCYKIANFMASGGAPKKAFRFLNDFLKKYPTLSVNNRELFASTYGYIYDLLGNQNLAEQSYLEMLRLDQAADQENGKRIGYHLTLAGGGALFIIGKYYTQHHRFKEGKKYLEASLKDPQYFDRDQELDTHKLLFKADSALGNFIPAIRHFARHKALDDSINNLAARQKISELNIKYEADKKSKDIKLLENKQKLQEAVIERSNTIRDVMIGGVVVLLLLATLAFWGFKSKQKINRRLESQQEAINTQNIILQRLLYEKDGLLADKDGLLKEKDWLLREVHHRVKNNLQIIMSLLRAQAGFLQNADAKEAIAESENRVNAIALIHQKLYNNDQIATINMPAYVSDLVNNLSNGLGVKKIKFIQAIDSLHIELSQAVPVGLILNEAITNAVKYAFNGEAGQITISFAKGEHDLVKLTVADNGRGLPENFDAMQNKSLGLQMMNGLTRQLRGVFEISGLGGVTVSLRFKLHVN
ncbi:tetratricopeptide repeat-containing sensor histidine kinase [Mucilaginibacter gossypii]|uniref:histidine kinase n=1 Tax=Mucilaginibacter gossypii TaxID=551996 RepID=A0A1G8N677_9SPHI|nr:histidine kinase dimerization/phosphoacceptor domain -containing protein [Mucilaginibacter gossypii]SDI75801.1 Two-component sensor histidine kinase, contains HisKA and HATPase domains [Mucilaginibacter gossypii]